MKLFVSLVCLLVVCNAEAQQQPTKRAKPTDLRESQMDIGYWPNNYPFLKIDGKAKTMPVARVIYGRPLMKGRNIFGGILKYGDLWRLGANEATEIEFFSNVKIAGKFVAKGRYTMYCIPNETKWTIILSNDNYSWGSFSYNRNKDVLRTVINVEKTSDNIEAFTMYFDETKSGANLVFVWDNLRARLPIASAH